MTGPGRIRLVALVALAATSLTGCVHFRENSDAVANLMNAPKERIDGRVLVTALLPDEIRGMIDASITLSPSMP